MAITAYPLDSVNDQPSYHGRALRTAQIAPLAAGASATRPLGARSGVRPGTPESVVEASPGRVIVHPHAGQLDLGNQLAGPYGYSVLSDETLAVTGAHATYARSDLVCITLTDPAEGGTDTPQASVVVVTGTPAVTPADPPVPAAARLTLARLSIPASGGGAPSVVWLAPMAGAADGVPHYATPTQRDQVLAAGSRWVGMCCTTGTGSQLVVWSWGGTAWREVSTKDSGWQSGGSKPAGVIYDAALQYRVVGSFVDWRGRVYRSAGWTSSGDLIVTDLPAAIRPAGPAPLVMSSDLGSPSAILWPDGSIRVYSGSWPGSWPRIGGRTPIG